MNTTIYSHPAHDVRTTVASKASIRVDDADDDVHPVTKAPDVWTAVSSRPASMLIFRISKI